MNLKVIVAVFIGLAVIFALPAQTEDWPESWGDPAIAEKYLLWAEEAIAAGQWGQAKAVLERAVDFADVSSDIPYLLALTRIRLRENRRGALSALKQAIETGRWDHYGEGEARLLEADQFIALRGYSAALNSLDAYKAVATDDAESAVLRLKALKGLNSAGPGRDRFPAAPSFSPEFRRVMRETLDLYPRDPRPLRLLFSAAQGGEPAGEDLALVELALKRLPFLLETDPDLAWMAAPFTGDVTEARRLVGSYRTGSLRARPEANFRPNPASLVPALNLGLLDDIDAIEEFFALARGELVLDKDLVTGVFGLLRSREGRDLFTEQLHSFTGVITEDEDRDGYAENRAVYRQGILQEYACDADQDGQDDLSIMFMAGDPQWAELRGAEQVLLLWEHYPSVQRAVLGRETFLPAPGGFQFAPLQFIELGGSDSYAGLLFPRRDPRYQNVSRHTLASFAVSVQRLSGEFEGGVERVYLRGGVPVRAEVTLDGMTVSVTEFENGRPVTQRADLDLDGRMETLRRFRRGAGGAAGALESSESDWNGDGVYEYRELYREDGSVVH